MTLSIEYVGNADTAAIWKRRRDRGQGIIQQSLTPCPTFRQICIAHKHSKLN